MTGAARPDFPRETRVRFPARHAPGVVLEGVLLEPAGEVAGDPPAGAPAAGDPAGAGALRAAAHEAGAAAAGGMPCVISHPHPLAGGDMDHPVVVALWRAAAAAGLRALRYNFRGVGGSTGQLSERSPLALADLAGAIGFLGGGPVLAAGYSYGARATLHAIHAGEPIRRAALVGLPTRLPANAAAMSNLLLGRRIRAEQYTEPHEIGLVADAPVPVRVLAGDRDPLVEFEALEDAGVAPVRFAGCNHFFSRRLGNQPPAPADLDDLARAAVGFLLGG